MMTHAKTWRDFCLASSKKMGQIEYGEEMDVMLSGVVGKEIGFRPTQ